MRPRGDVREAIYAAAVARDVGGATFIELADEAQRDGLPISRERARITVLNMLQAGDLVRVGSEHRAHSRRCMTIYAAACTQPGLAQGQGPPLDHGAANPLQAIDCGGSDALAFAMRGWPRC